MYVRPLHLTDNFDSYISGEVTIHPSAAIAPGVLLQASPNSRIIIGAGVCIGMGSILHAHEGTLEVESGANLGAGVLVVGKVKIGADACIGTATTILNCSVEPRQVVASGSLLGDESRQVVVAPAGAVNGVAANSSALTPAESSKSPNTEAVKTNSEPPAAAAEEKTSEPTQSPSDSVEANNSQVHGQVYLNRLLTTMFPHRQSLNPPEGGSRE